MGSQDADAGHLNAECKFSTTLADGQVVKGWRKERLVDDGWTREGGPVTGWSQEAACEAFPAEVQPSPTYPHYSPKGAGLR